MTVCEQKAKEQKLNHMSLAFWKDAGNYHVDLPSFKRAIELFTNDSRFKFKYLEDRQKTLDDYGLSNIKSLELDILVDYDIAKQYPDGGEKDIPILVRQYRQFIQCKQGHSRDIREVQPDHAGWRKWRKRMVYGTLWREGVHKYQRLVHAPYTVEFTYGCTVGCWFCGVSAEKFQGPVEMTDQVKSNWRDFLSSFNSICGQKSAQNGFCYWATDPLDHPQYEWFLEQFHDILGYWPQTTTAQVLKHAPRTRALFKHIQSKNGFVQRFSMTRSTDQKKIMEFFTPEELFLCELIPQYDNTISPKATAGRVRDLVLSKKAENKDIPFKYDLEHTGSIACVSGFLVNLVERSIKLITPCTASDRWPLGYRILGERTFEYEDSIEPLLLEMLACHINNRLLPNDYLKAHCGVVFSSSDNDVLTASSLGYSLSIKNVKAARKIAEMLRLGSFTVEDICNAVESEDCSRTQVMIALYQLFDMGIFDEEIIDSNRQNLLLSRS